MRRRGLIFGLLLGVLALQTPGSAATYTWTGSSGDGNWSNSGNWSGGVPVSNGTACLNFASTGNYAATLNDNLTGSFTLNQLTFASGSPSVHLTGNAISFSTTAANDGIYQNSASTVTVDNALSWAGNGVLTLSAAGTGSVNLTRGLSATAVGGTVEASVGALVLSTSAALTTAANGNLYVGYSGPAALTIQDSAKVSIGGDLDINYQASGTTGPSMLTLTSGSLSVIGKMVVGRATMNADPSTTSAATYQSGGTASVSGLLTVGNAGTAMSLYDISGGTLSAKAGLQVGYCGNGDMNIHGSGLVKVTGGQGLVIGQDANLATSGLVSLSAGTLSVMGDITLGSNGGAGTLSRSGGSMTVAGNLAVAGNATLILDDTLGSVATSFGGQLSRGGTGTLVIIPKNGDMDLGTSGGEAVSVASNPAPSGGIIGPWAVRAASNNDSSADYLTAVATSGAFRLVTATYTSFGSATVSSVVAVTVPTTLSQDASVSAVKFGPYTTTLGGQLSIGSGGLILNGGTVTGGTVSVPGGIVPLVYAGSNNPSKIDSSFASDSGFVKFGPGSLILSGSNSGLSGAVLVNSGVLNLQNALALGKGGTGSPVTVAVGASLELQNNIAVGNVPITLNGSGVGGLGSLQNVQDSNSLAGTISLESNSQINTVGGTLTLSGPLQGNYMLTKTGSGTLALTGSSGNQFPMLVTVASGVLNVQNGLGLGQGNTLGVAVTGGGALQVQGGITVPAVPLTLSGVGPGGNGSLESVSGSNSYAGAVTLVADSQVNVDAAADTLTLGGNAGGGFALSKGGAGTLVLSGSNSFSGALNVLSGTLSVASVNNAGSVGPLGQGVAPIALGSSGSTGTFLYTGTGATTNRSFTLATSGGVFSVPTNLGLSGVIGGNGSLTKAGSGTLTLSAANTYTGTTTVANGTLAIGSVGAINGTTGIAVNQGALLQVTTGASGSSQLPDSGNITLSGGGLSYVGNGTGSTDLGELVGSLILNPGQSTITTSRSAGMTSTPYLCFASGLASRTIGATVNFSTDGNSYIQFQSNPPFLIGASGIIGGYAYYNGTDFATWNYIGPSGYPTVQVATYANSDPGEASGSGGVNFRPLASFSTSSTRTFNSLNLTGGYPFTITGSGSVMLNSGGLIGNTTGTISGGTLGAANGELIVNTVQHLTISSVVNASAALVKTGSATLTLTSTSPIAGDTYLNQGILEYAPTGNLSYGGVISGAANLLKSGSATLTLAGTNTYYGGTTVAGGALCVSGSLAAGTSVNVQSGAVLTGGGTVGGNVSASGGTIAQSQGGSITGTVTDTSGTLTVGQSGVGNYLNTVGGVSIAGSGTLVASSAAATIGGSLNYTSSANSTFSGVVVGGNSTVTLGSPAGTLTLSGSNQYGGGTVIQSGTLKTANTNALGTGGLALSGGELDLDGFSTTVPSLSGSGGTVTTSTGTSTLSINSTSGISTTYLGSIQGSVALVKSGSGTLTLLGSNSYGGTTTVTGGVLEIGSAGSLPSGTSLAIGSGAGVVFDADSAERGTSDDSVLGQTGQAMVPIATQLAMSPVAGGSNFDGGATAPVPEPGTLALILAAALGLGWSQLRRRAGR